MANNPPPYSNITGISRAAMKDNAQESLANYDGNARPGELVVNLEVDPPLLYVGNNLGQLTLVASGGNAGGNTDWANIGNINNANGPTVISIGLGAGTGLNSVSIGHNAGNTNQSSESVAIGPWAGLDTQGYQSIAIGNGAGTINQGNLSIAIGTEAALSGQQDVSIAIGASAGSNAQGQETVAIGKSAGYESQGNQSIAIGNSAGQTNQGVFSISIGQLAGTQYQGNGSIAIGQFAGQTNQGEYSIAIGAYAGGTYGPIQANNSIIFNATGADLPQTTANTFTVKPVRGDSSANLVAGGFLAVYYNPTTGEFAYASS